ncbi:signal peptide peptidase SppA [Halorubrum sp. JWXQ-INN 858]|uniref:signal peptide peptidase SppA n=1 Tax=Halorubrum sp. JWXQ-INN 858 TaxID=2690782 RepID=UPI00135A3E51|nr:signal peptide peptidase SppA [Halorubrum sp. JWXQ-INN 858]MWV65738.1 signal peptide peptidase SppA [Halorubrum sp. JWXQ-INN 858]
MDSEPRSKGRTAIVAAVVLTATATLACRRIVGRLTRGRIGGGDEYNVAEVEVSGPIVRQRRTSPLSGATGSTADHVVESIEEADEDDAVEALLLRINTPGGEVLPSDDIRRAAADFDGPTVAYATDLCASGGYWIASGCDELWAHDASLVGSIGVVGSRPNAAGLAEKLGISYEQFTAGEYKDAGVPLREIEEDEREYLQGIIDGYYEQFVETVSEGRDMDPDDVRETEARVYLGTDAADVGLVDDLGTRADVEDRLATLVDDEPEIREFMPAQSLAERIGIGAERVAFAAGSGVASAVTGDGDRGDVDVELR